MNIIKRIMKINDEHSRTSMNTHWESISINDTNDTNEHHWASMEMMHTLSTLMNIQSLWWNTTKHWNISWRDICRISEITTFACQHSWKYNHRHESLCVKHNPHNQWNGNICTPTPMTIQSFSKQKSNEFLSRNE